MDLLHNPVQVPAFGDALQLVLASVFERQATARNQVSDRRRHEDLAGAGERGDTGADVHGDPVDAIARQVDGATNRESGLSGDPEFLEARPLTPRASHALSDGRHVA